MSVCARIFILFLALVWGVLSACSSGGDRPPGRITGKPLSPEAVADRNSSQIKAVKTLNKMVGKARALPAKQILFGDLHVHTTYSIDAFAVELPLMGQQGIHTPADACDFARHCAALDFYALTDHSENFLPEHWQESKKSLRQCAKLSDEQAPDLIPFAGWEWTQVGLTAETHWGHKNVILPSLEEDQLPARPISSRPDGESIGLFNSVDQAVWGRYIDPLNWKDYSDLKWLLDAVRAVPQCPKGIPSRELPLNCYENAPTPADLFAKLDEWGLDALVIPHGNTWGLYTPPAASWDKALSRAQHRADWQGLVEIMSGHGNSEEYRPWRPVVRAADGGLVCPSPSADFLPCCHQAGEIMRRRCEGLSEELCEQRVSLTKRLALEAGASFAQVISDATPEEWLNCNQCEDCFKPSYGYNPKESVQYALSLGNFAEPDPDGRPQRFDFGFIAATDDHTSRPGTGYKQYERRKMTFASGPRSRLFPSGMRRDMDDPQMPQRVETKWVLPDAERAQSFTFPGGIVGIHAQGRSREAVWAALKRKETYGTSGPRILLWFDLLNGPEGRQPMGSKVTLNDAPRFEVRAVGDFVQKPGCPPSSQGALSPDRLDYLCVGECYNPSDVRHPIVAIEVVRIRPQAYRGENVNALIEDPWRRFECDPSPDGCVVRFGDAQFSRDSIYYVRALQEATPAINGATMGTEFNEEGQPVAVNLCHGDYRTPFDDNCLASVNERAWASPIYINHAKFSP